LVLNHGHNYNQIKGTAKQFNSFSRLGFNKVLCRSLVEKQADTVIG